MTKFLPAVLLLWCVTLVSCKKQSAGNITAAQDNAAIETEYSAIYDMVADFASTDPFTGKTDSYILPMGAKTIFTDSLLSDSDGLVFTIDFGLLDHGGTKKGIECKDGRYRAGKIRVGMTKRFSSTPCVVTISISTADEYYVGNGTNMYRVTGLQTITLNNSSSAEVEVNNATMQRDNGTAHWDAELTFSTTHNEPGGIWGDEYEITGSAAGANKDGKPFTVQITSALKKKISVSCLGTFTAGEWKLSSDEAGDCTLDYDPDKNEQCNNTAAVVYDDHTQSIEVW